MNLCLDDSPKRFGQLARQQRIALRLTQQQVAARVSLDRSQISRIESGDRGTSLATALRLASVLGVDLSTLLEAP